MPGDLGDRVGLVGRLQRRRSAGGFLGIGWAQAWVDARRAEEQQPLDPGGVGRVEDASWIRRLSSRNSAGRGGVRHDATHAGARRAPRTVRAAAGKYAIARRPRVAQVELRRPPSDEFLVAAALQLPRDRGTDQTAVTRDVDSRLAAAGVVTT